MRQSRTSSKRTSTRKRKPRPQPRPIGHHAILEDFLAARLLEAELAKKVSKEMAKAATGAEQAQMRGQVVYWHDVAAAMKWALSRVKDRERHLLGPTPEEAWEAWLKQRDSGKLQTAEP